MTQLSFIQIQDLYNSANHLNMGGTSPGGQAVASHVKTMAAVAIAESSGDPNVVNASGHYGLWQIAASHALDPGWPFGPAGSSWLDPTKNAQMAEWVYQKQGYGAWVGYTSGAWKNVSQGAPGDQLKQIVTDTLHPFTSVTDFLNTLAQTATWVRVAKVVGGVALVMIGVSAILRPVTEPVVGAAAKVAKVAAL